MTTEGRERSSRITMPLRSRYLAALLVLLSSAAFAQPAPARLISPSADVVGSTITFTWHSSAGATWYQFWLGKSDTTLVTEQWYTADHAGCATGGSCAIALTPSVHAGAYVWHVRTWSSAGYGEWSPGHMFTVRDVVQAWSGRLPPSRRFTLVLGDQAVLDNETGLVWQRVMGALATTWEMAGHRCASSLTGQRMGWRLPTLAEITSVIDHVPGNPIELPPGHPFTGPGDAVYWTASVNPNGAHFVVTFPSVEIGLFTDEATTRRIWCVRGSATGH
jgi:hypothetical protein